MSGVRYDFDTVCAVLNQQGWTDLVTSLQSLHNAGVQFSFGFLEWRAVFSDKAISIVMPVSPLTLGKANKVCQRLFQIYVIKFLSEANSLAGQHPVKGLSLGTGKLYTGNDDVLAGTVKYPKGSGTFDQTCIPSQKLLQARKPLMEVTKLGQPVFGTTKDSLYWSVALGPLRMAARLEGPKLSLRVEGAFTPETTEALEQLGFAVHMDDLAPNLPTRMTGHFLCEGFPFHRMLGALFYHPVLHWDAVVPAGKIEPLLRQGIYDVPHLD